MLWPMVYSSLNLYETDRKVGNGQLQFDCLYYYVANWTDSYELLRTNTSQILKYCRRPLNETSIPRLSFPNQHQHIKNYTFKQLRQSNITIDHLISWNAPVDLAERYFLYIEQSTIDDPSSKEIFYRCKDPWFGLRCEYAAAHILIDTDDHPKESFYRTNDWYVKDMINTNRESSCYVHLTCDRGSPMCLDWREICNGQIDCIDDGADEAQCFLLEINECADDEYRCHNGLCIPLNFYKDDAQHPDCLDRSDEPTSRSSFSFCSKDPRFRCEDQVCRSNDMSFSCADGQCVNNFKKSCVNGRNNLVKTAMKAKGNLSHNCSLFMICHTLMIDKINGESCANLSVLSNANNSDLFICESLFQFPTIPVLYGHVRFLYDNNQSKLIQAGINLILPDYICYDAQLCDFISSTFHYQNLTCRHRQQIPVDADLGYDEFLLSLSNYFRPCAAPYIMSNDEQYRQHSSLYCCKNSSKCISKHRLMDRVRDCSMGDDENYKLSCSLQDMHRFKCSDQDTTCWSPSVDPNSCTVFNQKLNLNKILFQNICDGVVHLLPQEIDGQSHSDETECQHWPCSNIYTRCDSFKACPDGHDEYDCLDTKCPLNLYPCISPINYTIICLLMDQVADNIIDCLGATDELQYCYISHVDANDHCWNVTDCISPDQLCDHFRSCPSPVHENFCHKKICLDSLDSIDEAREIFCPLAENKNAIEYFSLKTARIYPLLEESLSAVQFNQQQVKHQSFMKNTQFIPETIGWIRHCPHGLSVVAWQGGDTLINQCFCPPNYYGDLSVVQDTSMYHESILTSITPNQRCLRINELFNLTLLRLPRIRRVKYYHLPCQTRLDLWCFFDEIYMCVCTSDNHTNCIKFDHQLSYACKHNDFCDNGASCFQDDITCPSGTICICTDCYFGTRCQFYAKGFGLTLDDILRYELRRNFSLSQQRVSIKMSAIVTMFIQILVSDSITNRFNHQSNDSSVGL
ncbi:unnamed protein product [Adineta steineri]|uniref:EGF-like domain-containing protein n=1 Tax=Adineta steineri TaxID=433720 RepID=A0A814IFB8_9BILA|nr:unnamed protein product [Adineta steineri]CAF1043939.1 unnamed protein product [Adineta steineri]